MVRQAKGHVWICCLQDEMQVREVEKKYHISSKQLSEHGVQMRLISEKMPNIDCVPAGPTLEDAYIYKCED